MSVILPYTNLGESIEIHLDFGKIGVSVAGENTFLVERAAPLALFTVGIEAQVPGRISRAFPPGEQADPPMEVIATLVSVDGSTRKAVPLTRRKASLYTGSIKIDPAVIQESARVSVYVVRAASGSAVGFARHKGARLAWSAPREIRLAERSPIGGSYMKIVWEDFASSTVVPRDFVEALFHLETSGASPVLYLNRNIKSTLFGLIEARGHIHGKAHARDAVLRSIAAIVWIQLARRALDDLREEAITSAGEPVDLDASIDDEWKREVIRRFAPLIWPRVLPDAAVLDVCTQIGDPGYFSRLVDRLPLAVQGETVIREFYERLADGVFGDA